jgi:xanthine dehydrogenase accessory factor
MMGNIYLHIPEYDPGSFPLVLATVISTEGSTPRKPGSSALFSRKGLLYGTVGGGVLEGRVQKIAQEAARTSESNIYHFEFNNDISLREEAICGGRATILIDATLCNYQTVFEQVKTSLQNKIPCVMVTIFSRTGEKDVHIVRFMETSDGKSKLPEQFKEKIKVETDRLLESSNPDDFFKIDISSPGKEEVTFALLEPLFPPLHLVIAGAGHIGKALSHLGRLLDFEVTVIDDRIEFANRENLPDAEHIIVEDVGKAMQQIDKTHDTYIVIVTRGHNDDSAALRQCIGCGAVYTGMIGSRTKIEKMHRNFVQNGWATEEQWTAIHSPIGLDIGSQTVEEIAVSIAAELVLERNKRRIKRKGNNG